MLTVRLLSGNVQPVCREIESNRTVRKEFPVPVPSARPSELLPTPTADARAPCGGAPSGQRGGRSAAEGLTEPNQLLGFHQLHPEGQWAVV